MSRKLTKEWLLAIEMELGEADKDYNSDTITIIEK